MFELENLLLSERLFSMRHTDRWIDLACHQAVEGTRQRITRHNDRPELGAFHDAFVSIGNKATRFIAGATLDMTLCTILIDYWLDVVLEADRSRPCAAADQQQCGDSRG